MQNNFDAYLDAFNRITIIIDKGLCSKEKIFCLINGSEVVELKIENITDLGINNKYICILNESILLHKDYLIIDESENRSFLKSGKVVRCDMFDMTYSYNGWLGFNYTPEETTFKIWSPVCKEIELELISTNDKISFHDLTYIKQGVWQITLKGDLEKFKYRYNIRVFEKFESVNDPYGISSTANGEYNYVIDLNKINKFTNRKPQFSGNMVDAIIYEASVRDLTSSNSSGAVYKRKFLGVSENHPTNEGYPTGIAYMNFLGITHLQLLPIFDFGGVCELDHTSEYNWGYNPENYNIPDGSYALNPNDPYSRINELCNLIDNAHANKIRVVMDVVFNHVYKIEEFPFDKLVPGYYYRFDKNDMLTNVSGCGNDLATERKMTRKFILDSVLYWTKIFNISGFRFDLMGLLDVETINLLNKELKKIDDTIILYGEGWDMPNTLPANAKPIMSNYQNTPGVAYFNDKYRDFFRGNQWNNSLGFCNGGYFNVYDLTYLVTGSCIDNYLFDDPNRTINYIECHDNYTFYDYTKKLRQNLSTKEYIDYQALGLSIVILSQGVPFIHAGQEFLRTKKGVENSYKHPDSINTIDWNYRDKNIELVLLLKELIKVRKSIKEFRYNNAKEISSKISFLGQKESHLSAMYKIEGEVYNYYIVIKNNYIAEELEVENFIMIFNGRSMCEVKVERVFTNRPQLLIYKRERR